MNERAAFEKFLNEHEDDATARLAFVDWLDEQGEHEEAERHRQWPAAKAWLVRFCEVNNHPEEADREDYIITYEKLLEFGLYAIDGPVGIYCGSNEPMCYALRCNSQEFFKNWSIITGIPLAAGVAEKSHFTCGC